MSMSERIFAAVLFLFFYTILVSKFNNFLVREDIRQRLCEVEWRVNIHTYRQAVDAPTAWACEDVPELRKDK